MQTKTIHPLRIFAITLLLILTGCAAPQTATPAPVIPTATRQVTPSPDLRTPTPQVTPSATACVGEVTIVEDHATAPVCMFISSDRVDILVRLLDAWFRQYLNPEVGEKWQLDDYEIESIHFLSDEPEIQNIARLYVFMTRVTYRVKPTGGLDGKIWAAGYGEILPDGWVQRTVYMGVRVKDGRYILDVRGPCPEGCA